MLRTMVCVPKAYSLLTMHSPPFSPRREAPSWRRKKFTWRPNYALLQLIQLNRIGSRRSCAWRSCAARRGGEGRHPGKKECFLRCDTVRAQVTRVMNRNWSLLLIIEMISELKENRWRGICYDLERHCLLLLRMESDTIFIVSRLLLRFQNSFSHRRPSFSSSSSLFYFIRQSAKIQAKILRRVAYPTRISIVEV